MNCRDSESLILVERDGALTDAQRAALSDHVATCTACRQLRANLASALDTYRRELDSVRVPNADEAWRDLRGRLHGKKRSLAPVIWLGAPLAAAAAFAFAFFAARPAAPVSPASAAVAVVETYDPSFIAGADFVEAGDPDASVMVFVDKESGWLVVWAADTQAHTKG